MRNAALEALDVLVGEWSLTLTDAWFLESREVRQNGHAVVRWIGDAFIELEAEMEGEPVWHFVFGRSDANERLIALYHDPRPTSRVFHMTFGDGRVDSSPPRSRLPPAFRRYPRERSDPRALGRLRGCRRYLAQGLRPGLRANRWLISTHEALQTGNSSTPAMCG